MTPLHPGSGVLQPDHCTRWIRVAKQGAGLGSACAGLSGGFTLLELLVALSIFALISAMAYGGLQSIMNQQQQTTARSDRLSDLQKAYRIMQRDLEQVVSRDVRNEFGDRIGAMVGGSGFDGVEFSRAGHPNPAGFLRSEILRVAYVPDQDTLLRRTWRVLDRAQDTEADEQNLVESMSRFTMRFLDQGKVPVTPTPGAVWKDNVLTASASEGASIGYRADGAPWRLYVEPVVVEAQRLEVKAVRYGWRESAPLTLEP